MLRFKKLFVWLLLLCVAPALAQNLSCPDIVQTALQAVEQDCQPTERNQACVGNLRLEATAQTGIEDFHFEQTGDIVGVTDLESLRLFPMDEEDSTWGVVLMRLQANLPDTLPGQNVMFLLFGDVELTNNVSADSEDYTPMQAFYLATGLGDTACAEAPESGLVVQTPRGAGQVTFNVNGVDVSTGSTVFFQAQRGGRMRVSTLDGASIIGIDDEEYPVIAGTYVDVPLDEELEPDGEPEEAEGYDYEEMQDLPLDMLGEDIEVEEPLTDEEISEMYDLMEAGEPLCSDDPDSYLPTCEHLPAEYGGYECTFDIEAYPDLPFCHLISLGDDGDSDGDGWLDSEDACPFYSDIYGTGIDEYGCPILSPDEDTDFDGFINSEDYCPYDGDIYGMGVDEFGCPILPPDEDTDFDGFINSEDSCPYDGDIYGTGIDEFGCPILSPDEDTDFDGFINSEDSCPYDGDIYGTGIDEFGCPYPPADVDSDGDGYFDSQDYCPYDGDIYGTGIDEFGCPYPPADVDSDGDGYLDSQDYCPYDGGSNGTGVDGSGCPNPPADVDSDGDGYLDSQDSCPYDGGSNGTGVDGSGCPNPPADVDSDGDGYFDSQDACPYEGDINATGVDGSGCPNPP
jgi:hypothetical protein